MDNIKQDLENTIREVLSYFDIQYTLEIQELQQEKLTYVGLIQSPGAGKFLIGKGGETLRSLELIVRSLLKRGPECSISIDVNDYKKLKMNQALTIVRDALATVRSTRKALALDPMNAYERRMVHVALATEEDVSTESIGEGSQRRIVIKPRK